MGASVVGQLQVLMSADSTQITADLGKARNAVRQTANEIKGMGAAGSTWSRLTGEIGGLDGSLRGASQATAAARQSLMLLGKEAPPAIGGLANALSGLVNGGFTPLGLAIAATVAGMSLLSSGTKEAEESAAKLEERHKAEVKALEEVAAAQRRLSEERAGARATGISRATGAPTGIAQAMQGVESAEFAIRELEGTVGWTFEQMRVLGRRLVAARAELSRQQDLSTLRGEDWQMPRAPTPDDSPVSLDGPVSHGQTIALPRAPRRRLPNFGEVAPDTPEVTALLREQATAAENLRRIQNESAAEAAGTSAREEELRRRIAEQQAAMTGQLGIEQDTRAAIVASYQEELRALEALREKKAAAIAEGKTDGLADGRGRDSQGGADLKKGDFASGFHDRVQQIAQDEGQLEKAGGDLADHFEFDIADGVTKGLDSIRSGATSAKEATRDFAADFARRASSVMEQALLLRAVGALFGAAVGGGGETSTQSMMRTTVPTSNAPGGAFGGVWQVAGSGGMDSRLVQMKLSPGELVKVSGGAGSGASESGGFYGTLVVRPPAVVANEVAARMDPDAKAGIVYSATRKSGRRGTRAGD